MHRRLLGTPVPSFLNIKINHFPDIIRPRGTFYTIVSYQAPFSRNGMEQDERERLIEKRTDGRLAIIYMNEGVLEFNYFR
jgi:hypothetical protein